MAFLLPRELPGIFLLFLFSGHDDWKKTEGKTCFSPEHLTPRLPYRVSLLAYGFCQSLIKKLTERAPSRAGDTRNYKQ